MKYTLPRGLSYNLIDPTYPAIKLAKLNALLQAAVSSEPDWGQNQAAGPTIRWLEYSHGNVGAGKAWALSQLPLVPGKPSPFFEALDNASQDGAELIRGSGNSESMAYLIGDMDEEWSLATRQMLVVAALGDIEDLTMYFEISDVQQEVPENFPDRMNGNNIHTWETWGGVEFGHGPVEIDNKWYRTSNVGQSGTPLKASIWMPSFESYIIGQGGFNVLTVTQYLAIAQANVAPL